MKNVDKCNCGKVPSYRYRGIYVCSSCLILWRIRKDELIEL